MNKVSNVPIFLKLRDEIAEKINSGQIGAGERLPSERDLVAKLGAARDTIREALRLLEGEGRIFSKRGSGYFVSPARWRYDPTRHVNASRLIDDFGSKFGITALKRREMLASPSIARMMDCSQETKIFLINSVALQDERRVCFEETYLLGSAFPGFLDLEYESPLTDFLFRSYDAQVQQVGFRARPTNLYGDIAESLGVRVGTPGLFISRIKAKDGVTIWVDCEYWLTDVLEIVIGDFPQEL
jgi:DNA-binding GntR family transcriptional regulator